MNNNKTTIRFSEYTMSKTQYQFISKRFKKLLNEHIDHLLEMKLNHKGVCDLAILHSTLPKHVKINVIADYMKSHYPEDSFYWIQLGKQKRDIKEELEVNTNV